MDKVDQVLKNAVNRTDNRISDTTCFDQTTLIGHALGAMIQEIRIRDERINNLLRRISLELSLQDRSS